MKKNERINQELFFINNKKHFTLNDLMAEFKISKSTALRDISSLEKMGVPLYVEYGKYGGYKVVNYNFLPPIYFTDDEVAALFFSAQMLKFFISTPFQAEYNTIVNKLLASIPDEKEKQIRQMQEKLFFNSSQQHKDSPFLKELLLYSVEQKTIKIVYEKNGVKQNRWIQPLGIQAMDGNWYCPSIDLEKNKYRVLRCDSILLAEPSSEYPARDLPDYDIINNFFLRKKTDKAKDFKVCLTDKGVEKFKKRHYPNMKLNETEQTIEGWYEPHETVFMTHYLLEFGSFAKIIAPDELIVSMKEYLNTLLFQYEVDV